MNIFSQNLTTLLEKAGWTKTFLAEKIGMDRGNLTHLLNGTRIPDVETTEEILVKGFDYRPSEARKLVAKWQIQEIKEKTDISFQAVSDIFEAKWLNNHNTEVLPILGNISCGVPCSAPALEDWGIDDLDTITLPKSALMGRKRVYAIRAEGDSMMPLVKDGSTVLVEPCFDYKGSRHKYILTIDNETLLGQLVKNGDKWEVTKTNLEYPPIPINSNTLKICGIAFKVIADL